MIRKAKDCRMEIKAQLRGGVGDSIFHELVTVEELAPHGKLFSTITLAPGSSIGEHTHDDNFEVYYILKGKGLVTEAEGETEVFPEDVVYTTHGESHAIRNHGDEDLILLAVIVYN